MVNDTTTLNGALSELGETMAANITTKGVSASASDGLTTLAGKILQISGDTPTPPTPTVLFEDGGVTGDKNTNYTKHSDVNVSTTSTGTTVSSVADCYPKCYSPNVTLTGDFEIEFTQLTNSNWWQLRVHFADTSNNVVDFAYLSGGGYNRLVTQNNGTKPDVGSSQNNGYANYTHTFPITVKITREGSTYSYYEDDDLKLTNTGTTNDVTFGFWSDDISRTVYKDLTIKSLGGTPYNPCATYIAEIDSAIEYINGSGS